jgi:DNA-binding response OmpR family regulator
LLTEPPNRNPLTGGQPRFFVQANRLAAHRGLRVLLVGRWTTGEALTEILASDQDLSGHPNNSNHAPKNSDLKSTLTQDGTSDGVAQEPGVRLSSFELVTLTNQKMALQEIRQQPPKVVLVEVDDKPESRLRFCEMIRYRLPTALIFAAGVTQPKGTFVFDGVLSLPLRADEVWAALQSVQEEMTDYLLQRGSIRLNLATRTVIGVNGQRHITPKQCALLHFLMLRANQVVSRSEIMERIWETNYLEDTRTLDVHIRWLRECIEPDPSTPIYLLTERGKGYYLSLPA